MNLLHMSDLGLPGAARVLSRAAELARGAAPRRLGGAVLLAFLQPSTRTRLGFSRAAIDVGSVPVTLDGVRDAPSTSTPESIVDTLAVASAYFEVVVVRSAASALEIPTSDAAWVSGGLGTDEHPTQALVDLFAVQRECGKLEGLRWGLLGDLSISRAARSLLRALRWFAPKEVRILAPTGRGADLADLQQLPTRNAGPGEVAGLDVLYVAGLPSGSGPTALDDHGRREWRVDRKVIDRLDSSARVLCPLPRIDEIDPDVDGDPRCAWFRQSAGGRYVRTAVLEAVWPPVAVRRTEVG